MISKYSVRVKGLTCALLLSSDWCGCSLRLSTETRKYSDSYMYLFQNINNKTVSPELQYI